MTDKKSKKLKLRSVAVDLKKERDGDMIPSSTYDGLVWTVRSVNCPAYRAARASAEKKLAALSKEQKVSVFEVDSYGVLAESVVDSLLIRWDGADEEYSPDVAKEILLDETHRDLLDDLLLAATKVGRLEAEYASEDAKN